tara:strand:+ start:219 stop:617 length:399 start_codon:yes stop_codon:yes gene_type:complete
MVTQNLPKVPENWLGSLPEWLVFEDLNKRGMRNGVEFTYQSPLMGGRIEKGGLVVDFIFNDPPDLAINVQGEYYHQMIGAATIARDKIARTQLAGMGITLIFIDAEDVMKDVKSYVTAALNYQDLSFLGRGG